MAEYHGPNLDEDGELKPGTYRTPNASTRHISGYGSVPKSYVVDLPWLSREGSVDALVSPQIAAVANGLVAP